MLVDLPRRPDHRRRTRHPEVRHPRRRLPAALRAPLRAGRRPRRRRRPRSRHRAAADRHPRRARRRADRARQRAAAAGRRCARRIAWRSRADQPSLWLPVTTSTFHGRDIFSPGGGAPRRRRRRVRRGRPARSRSNRSFACRSPRPRVADGAIETVVTYVDSFGNIRLAGGRDRPGGRVRRRSTMARGWPQQFEGGRARGDPLRDDVRHRSGRRIARLRRLAGQPRDGRQPGEPRRAARHRPGPAGAHHPGLSVAGPYLSFLSDFGTDTAPAVCRGVIWSILPDARINDLTHSSRQFGIRDGAFLLWSSLPLPPGRRPPGRRRPRRRHRAPARSRCRWRAAIAWSAPTMACWFRPPSALGGIVAAHSLENRALWRERSRTRSTAATSSRRWRPTSRPARRSTRSARPSTHRPGSARAADGHGSRRRPRHERPVRRLIRQLPPGRAARGPGRAARPARAGRSLQRAHRRRTVFEVPWQPTFGAVAAGAPAPLRGRRLRRAWRIGVNQGSAAERLGLAHDATRPHRARLSRWPRPSLDRGRRPHLPLPTRHRAGHPRHLAAHRARRGAARRRPVGLRQEHPDPRPQRPDPALVSGRADRERARRRSLDHRAAAARPGPAGRHRAPGSPQAAGGLDGARRAGVRTRRTSASRRPRSTRRSTTVIARAEIEHLAARTTDQLSGGESQQVAIAGTLMLDAAPRRPGRAARQPRPGGRAAAAQPVRSLADAGTAVVIVEHRVEDALHAGAGPRALPRRGLRPLPRRARRLLRVSPIPPA